MEQRDFARAALEYVCLIQEVQERKKFEFVETVSMNDFTNCVVLHQVQFYKLLQTCFIQNIKILQSQIIDYTHLSFHKWQDWL